jgi:stage III sporulation protein AF
MEFLNNWLQGIVVAVVIASIIQMILPNGNNKKYIKVVLGIYVVFQIITPVVNKFFNSNFEISSLIDIDSYTKKMETYEVSSQNTNIDKTNEDSIKQIYVANLEKDIKAKLEDKEYLIKGVEVQVEDNEKYDIKSMKIYLKEVVNSTKEESENNIHINEVEKIEIKVGQNNFNDSENETKSQTNESSISNEEKNKIKKYLTSVYEINEKQITIY